jgi:hypothetical protein
VNIVKVILSIALILINCSCAVNYIDDDGNQRIIGLVSIKLERPGESKLVAGDKVSISNVGILVSKGPVHTGLSIGYNSETSIVLKNDILTIIDKGLDDEKNE